MNKEKTVSGDPEPKATHAFEDFSDGHTSAGQVENSQVEMQTYKEDTAETGGEHDTETV